MSCPEHLKRRIPGAALIFLLLLLLLPAACAAAETHTVVVPCGGGGRVGNFRNNRRGEVLLEPAAEIRAEDESAWTPDRLTKLADFRLEGAALRFTATSVQGESLTYSLKCGGSRSEPQYVRVGRNLWDVTKPLAAWLESPAEPLTVVPMFQKRPWGMQTEKDSFSLQLTFTTSEKLPDFRPDKVRFSALYENSLSMLDENNPFLARYDDTADSLLAARLPLGVPYYYAGGSEEKFLRRFFPSTTTDYYQDSHMYLCGLDCVGMTRLVYEKSGMERHPSISDVLARGIAHGLLKKTDPSKWYMLLQPGDLICVKHGSFHVMMYIGTMRQFGWTEKTAGEAAPLLDAPLVIHCGGNPFYYERYKQYIQDQGFRNTYPPDGGVTVSAIQRTDRDAPHSTDTSWGKHFGWYTADGEPLLVFTLEDCTDIAWYGPETEPREKD